jgi:hypothetical protein
MTLDAMHATDLCAVPPHRTVIRNASATSISAVTITKPDVTDADICATIPTQIWYAHTSSEPAVI